MGGILNVKDPRASEQRARLFDARYPNLNPHPYPNLWSKPEAKRMTRTLRPQHLPYSSLPPPPAPQTHTHIHRQPSTQPNLDVPLPALSLANLLKITSRFATAVEQGGALPVQGYAPLSSTPLAQCDALVARGQEPTCLYPHGLCAWELPGVAPAEGCFCVGPWYGPDCATRCEADVNCTTHGRCNSTDGLCLCNLVRTEGEWGFGVER